DKAGRATMVDAELALQTIGRFLLACQLEHQRMHLQVDACQVVGRYAFFTQLNASVDTGVNDNAASKRLVRVEGDLEALAQLIGDLVPVVLGRNNLGVTPGRLDGATAGCESRF